MYLTRLQARRRGVAPSPTITATTAATTATLTPPTDIEKLERLLRAERRLQRPKPLQAVTALNLNQTATATVPDDDDDSVTPLEHGPKNVLETMYYDPAVPGSFGGVDALYKTLKREGVGKSRREIREWFESQPTYTLHKQSRKKFPRNRILVHGIDEQFQADLADVSMLARWNGGVHFWLVVVDVLSKYAWVVPLRNKSAPVVVAAFRTVFGERKPEKLQTDHGTEFTNSQLRDYLRSIGVHHFFTWNPDIKAAIVERLNRTLKDRVWRYMTYRNTNRYINVLHDIVRSYNNTHHRSIGMTPVEASRPENEKRAWQNLYGGKESSANSVAKRHDHRPVRFKYRIGDYVRLSEARTVFRKGYRQRWTDEVFRVFKQSSRKPVVYRLEDLAGHPLVGSFYEQELQKVSKPTADELERILTGAAGSNRISAGRYDRRGGHDIEFFVKFRGYPDYSQPQQQQQQQQQQQ